MDKSIMNTPLAPAMSTLLHTCDNIQPEIPSNQLSPYNQSTLFSFSNDSFELLGDSFFHDFLVSSVYQDPAAPTCRGILNQNIHDESAVWGEIPDFADEGISPTNCTAVDNLIPPIRSSRIENDFCPREPSMQHHSSDYYPPDLQVQSCSEPQFNFQSDASECLGAFGTETSPMHVMNEQFTTLLSYSNACIGALDPLYHDSAPFLNNHPYTIKQASRSSLGQLRQAQPVQQTAVAPVNAGGPPVKKKRRRRRKPPPPPEVAAAKRRAFLQRNREAASKCRTKKKYQIDKMEDEIRMSGEINAVLKDEFNEILDEVESLREQVNDMTCGEDCNGCGELAPMRRDSVITSASIGTCNESFDRGELEAGH